MMKKNITELVFILDKSGSMAGLEADTIGGFNAMLKKQQKAEGEAFVTTVLFDHDYELLHDRIHVKGISPITEKDYEVGGTTALLDAIGFTIQKIKNVQKRTNEDERAEKVLFVITTDGMENASREYTADKIKKMVRIKRKNMAGNLFSLVQISMPSQQLQNLALRRTSPLIIMLTKLERNSIMKQSVKLLATFEVVKRLIELGKKELKEIIIDV